MTGDATLGLTLGDLARQHHAGRVGVEATVGLELGPESVRGISYRHASVPGLARLQLVVMWQRLHGFAPGDAIFPEYVLAGTDFRIFVKRAGRNDYRATTLRLPGQR